MEQERKLPGTEQATQQPSSNEKKDEVKPAPELDELDNEIDTHLKEAPEDLTGEEGDDGETVTLKKSDLEKYKTKTSNLVKGLTSVKTRVKDLKGKVSQPAPAPQGQDHQQSGSSAGQPDQSQYVTRQELHRANEKDAIKLAEQDKVLSDNWNEVMTHFSGKRGRQSKEDIVADINDAFILWQHNNPDKAKQAGITGVRKLQIELAGDTKPAGASSDGQNANAPKKSVMPKKSNASDWYKKDKK